MGVSTNTPLWSVLQLEYFSIHFYQVYVPSYIMSAEVQCPVFKKDGIREVLITELFSEQGSNMPETLFP